MQKPKGLIQALILASICFYAPAAAARIGGIPDLQDTIWSFEGPYVFKGTGVFRSRFEEVFKFPVQFNADGTFVIDTGDGVITGFWDQFKRNVFLVMDELTQQEEAERWRAIVFDETGKDSEFFVRRWSTKGKFKFPLSGNPIIAFKEKFKSLYDIDGLLFKLKYTGKGNGEFIDFVGGGGSPE